MVTVPVLPDEFLERGWQEAFSESKHELELPFFTITSHNVVYDAPNAEDRHSLVAIDVDTGPRSVFATALEFDPSLPSLGVKPSSVFGPAKRHARKEFARSVEEDGLLDVSRTDARWLERADGTRARAFRYEVSIPLKRRVVFGDRAREVRKPFVLQCRMWAAIWPTREAYSMAGGIYPVESIADAADRQAPGVPVITDLEVEVDPERHRKELARAMQTIGS